MNDVLIKAYHGGLGDCLQFSTLPEQFSRQQGRETYVLDESHFRNKEIYDLVWGCNPYIKGVKSGHWNAGDIPDIQFTNRNGYHSCIRNWEELHGLTPTNDYPKIYYEPKKIEGYEDSILVDLSSISLKHNGDKRSFPPAYDPKEVTAEYEKIRKKYPDKKFIQVFFEQDLGSQSIQIDSDDGVLVTSIFHYCDLMRSSFGIIGLYSGQSALSAAILEYNPDLLSFCMVSEAVYNKHSAQSGFIFDKLNYIIIPETEEVQDTSIH